MRSDVLDILLREPRIASLLGEGQRLAWERQIAPDERVSPDEWGVLCRSALLLSNAALLSPLDDTDYAQEGYLLLSCYPIADENARHTFEVTAGYDLKDQSLLYHFYLASLALKLDKTITARLLLKDYDATAFYDEEEWGQRTLYKVLKSLLLLIRKHDGMADIREALRLIDELRSEQAQFEESSILSLPLDQQRGKALTLVAIYHVSKAVYDTADYLINGHSLQQRRINSTIRQHIDIALQLIPHDSRLNDFFRIIWNDLQLLVKNSIWTHTGFQNEIKRLSRMKAENGILELLPSQQDALAGRMLDVVANAIVLQMPTSAGKTLMAEFNILVTRSLRPDAKIVYVVPSRALMNQVYFDLRDDLRGLGLSIERTSSAVEVDPTEDQFLQADQIDILVCTPEKLDLLIRRNHPSVSDVSLFVIDEAHTIENGQRGARLELLLTMLHRERAEAKFMLLSPFLPDAGESLAEWLGGGHAIQIDWRPSEKLVFGLRLEGNKAIYDVLPTALSTSIRHEHHREYASEFALTASGDKRRILEYATRKYGVDNKTMLILCQGRKTANTTAANISGWMPAGGAVSDEVRLVAKYMDEEIGCQTLYTRLLSQGVSVHHAGLSDETKILIEHLIRRGDIRYVCATTTIAEGVNFPVSSVYFDTYTRGRNKTLSANDFWNIAGRAGRTMVDDYGKIILPFNSDTNIATARQLIAHGAEQLTSVLAQLFVERERVLATLSEDRAIWKLSNAYPDSFGPLFQYFVHLLNVSDNAYATDIEDLFKDSLAYTLLDATSQRQFIELCRQIYLAIQNTYSQQRGALKFADKTGFSVPSVLNIMRAKSDSPAIADLDSWRADALFDRNRVENLTEKIRVVAALKETQMGTDSTSAPFNPAIAAQMLIAWVKGDKLDSMSEIHPHFQRMPEIEVRVSEFVKHMNDMRFKASWGLSALEGIVRGSEDNLKDSYIPSYVYYGVDAPKPLAMRMLGIPRSLSGSLSQVIEGNVNEYSFTRIRQILSGLTATDWDALRPVGSNLSGAEWKRVVEILMK